jgi:DNA uptake protein ComE-like DNA-binding protein
LRRIKKLFIDYRSRNGPFEKVEDIKNVEGIGDKALSGYGDFVISV